MGWIEILFWSFTGIIFYTFLGYGILLFILVKIKRLTKNGRRVTVPGFEPEVTLVIPCFNEAAILADKLRNSQSLDYPHGKLRLVLITDGSTDGSEIIFKDWPGLEILHEP